MCKMGILRDEAGRYTGDREGSANIPLSQIQGDSTQRFGASPGSSLTFELSSATTLSSGNREFFMEERSTKFVAACIPKLLYLRRTRFSNQRLNPPIPGHCGLYSATSMQIYFPLFNFPQRYPAPLQYHIPGPFSKMTSQKLRTEALFKRQGAILG